MSESYKQLEFDLHDPVAEALARERAAQFILQGKDTIYRISPKAALKRQIVKASYRVTDPERVFSQVEKADQRHTEAIYENRANRILKRDIAQQADGAKRQKLSKTEIAKRAGYNEDQITKSISERQTARRRVAVMMVAAGLTGLLFKGIPNEKPTESLAASRRPAKAPAFAVALPTPSIMPTVSAPETPLTKPHKAKKSQLVSLAANGHFMRIQSDVATLDELAQLIETQYGDQYEVGTLAAFNGMDESADIQGESIKFYDCNAGATPIQEPASKIAAEHNLSLQQLYDLNGGKFRATLGLCVKVEQV